MLKDIFINCKQWHFENDEILWWLQNLAKIIIKYEEYID